MFPCCFTYEPLRSKENCCYQLTYQPINNKFFYQRWTSGPLGQTPLKWTLACWLVQRKLNKADASKTIDPPPTYKLHICFLVVYRGGFLIITIHSFHACRWGWTCFFVNAFVHNSFLGRWRSLWMLERLWACWVDLAFHGTLWNPVPFALGCGDKALLLEVYADLLFMDL